MLLRTLGAVTLAGSRLTRPKPLLLLVYLSLEGPRARRHLAELFWPSAADPMKSLRVALAHVGRGAPGAIHADGRSARTAVPCDAGGLRDALDLGDHRLAVDLYTGGFLDGFHLADWGAELEEWVYETRESLAGGVRDAFLALAEVEAGRADFAAAGRLAEAAYLLPGAPPAEPSALERLYRLMLACGSRHARKVRDETRAVGIRSGGIPIDPPASPVRARYGSGLPVERTALVGRDGDVRAVRALLLRPDVRLVTLAGPGGIGKTRVAMRAASDLVDAFEDGVSFVDLGPVADAGLVAATIARALEVRGPADQPLDQVLKRHLKDRHLLLVLDDVEGVIDAAPLIADLLSGSRGAKVLVTSRELLRLYGEHVYWLPPLGLPASEGMSLAAVRETPAVELFVQRARARSPAFDLGAANARAVAELCLRLDGLPLAIELAAARIDLLTPQAMLGRIDGLLDWPTGSATDAPTRQRTLRATIDWSHGMLSKAERVLFRRLAVFANGCTLAAGETICGPGARASVDVPVGLSSLLGKSLLQAEAGPSGETRFRMLDTIRAYARDRLMASEDAADVARRHADHYLEMAEGAAERLHGPEQQQALEELDAEHDNLRLALRHAGEAGRLELELRLVGALYRYWELRGRLAEGATYLDTALSRSGGVRNAARATALRGRALLAAWRGRITDAQAAAAESLAIAREAADQRGIAQALNLLAALDSYWLDARRDEARERFEESLAIMRGIGDRRGTAIVLHNLGNHLLRDGDLAAAEARYAESLALREVGEQRDTAMLLFNMAHLRTRRGEHDAATGLLREGLRLWFEIGERQGIAYALESYAVVLAHSGRHLPAATLLGAAAAIRRAIDTPRPTSDPYGVEHVVQLARSHLGETAFDTAHREGHALSPQGAVRYALDLNDDDADEPGGPA